MLDSTLIKIYTLYKFIIGGHMEPRKILFQLDDDLHKAILAEQKRTGASLSEIVRRAIIYYLKFRIGKIEKPEPPQSHLIKETKES